MVKIKITFSEGALEVFVLLQDKKIPAMKRMVIFIFIRLPVQMSLNYDCYQKKYFSCRFAFSGTIG
ncbi:hypothetical protein D3C87_1753220 [compost metagenome]